MPEEQKEQFQRKPISRRQFLKGAAALGVAVGAGSLLKGETPQVPVKELPKDFLTEEKLREAHITIHQTPNVKLSLRQGIFDFPLFRDAKEGKLAGVNIVLVDHQTVSWNASKNFPLDAKLVYQNVNQSPPEEWVFERNETEKSLEDWQKSENDWANLLTKADNEEERKEFQKHLDHARQKQEELKEKLEYLENNKIKWIEERADDNGISGLFVNLQPIDSSVQTSSKDYPELENKVFIFLAVGGSIRPRPKHSFLNPKKILVNEIQKEKTGISWVPRFIGGEIEQMPGFTLRHEVSHYKKQDPRNQEFEADTRAFESFIDAWQKFKETGDISGYPFVFVTREGITFTKRPQKPKQLKT